MMLYDAFAVDPALFDRYLGRYKLLPNFILNILREGDRRFSQATGQPKAEIFPEGDREFFLKVVDAQITFETDDTAVLLDSSYTRARTRHVGGPARVN
jgi:hypothetical protein